MKERAEFLVAEALQYRAELALGRGTLIDAARFAQQALDIAHLGSRAYTISALIRAVALTRMRLPRDQLAVPVAEALRAAQSDRAVADAVHADLADELRAGGLEEWARSVAVGDARYPSGSDIGNGAAKPDR